MSIEHMPDERLARYYENIRQQVEAERACKYKFMTNPTVINMPVNCEASGPNDEALTYGLAVLAKRLWSPFVAHRGSDAINDGGPMFHKSGGPGGPNADATKVAKIMLLIRAKVKKSKIHGVGLFAAQFVSKGTKTWKLKPKIDLVITASEYKKLPKSFRKNIDHHIYQCKFTGKWIFCTDDARFMNHSTKPNIKTVRGMYDVSLRDIRKGEELTEDYDRFE